MLSEIGIGKVDWEAGTLSSWFALSTMVTWRWVGYNALIYLAAMQAVPYELYESAQIDGASNWRQLFHITIPSIRPTIIFTVIISTIGGLQLFTEPYEFQPLKQAGTGGSDRQYQTVAMYLYEKAFGGSEFKFGYASAIAWTLFLLIAVISAVQLPHHPPDQVVGLAMVAITGRLRLHPRNKRRRQPKARWFTYVFLIVVALISLFPLYWSLVVASQSTSAVSAYPPVLVPGRSLFHNISRLFNSNEVNVDFWGAMVNTFIVASAVTISVVFFSALAGFAFAKLDFRGAKGLMVVIVLTIMVPVQLGVIPLYIEMIRFGWVGELKAVAAPNLVTAFGVFLMRQYIVQSVPDEMVDAARVDGCHTWRIFWHVILPAVRPIAAVLGSAHVHDDVERLLLAADRAELAEPDGAGRGVDALERLRRGLLARPHGNIRLDPAVVRSVLDSGQANHRGDHAGGGEGMTSAASRYTAPRSRVARFGSRKASSGARRRRRTRSKARCTRTAAARRSGTPTPARPAAS